MNGKIPDMLELDEVELIEFTLDKFLKLADNITREIINLGECKQKGQDHIVEITEYLYKSHQLTNNERDSFFDGSLEIPECVFVLLEKLIFGYYFTEFEPKAADTSSNSLSYTYAWSIYIRLAEGLGKKTKTYPYGKPEILQIEDQSTDIELEQETLKVLSILTRGTFLSSKNDCTVLDDYLNLLGRKGILSENELINAILTDDIEETLENTILKKLIAPGKIQNAHIIDVFNAFSYAFMESRREEGKNRVDRILANDEENIENENSKKDPLLSILSTGVSILQHLNDLGGELYDYDADELIMLATEMDILNYNISQKLIDLLSENIGNKAQVIIEVFEYVFYSGYLDDIDIDEEERQQLKSYYSDVLYSINMLYKS